MKTWTASAFQTRDRSSTLDLDVTDAEVSCWSLPETGETFRVFSLLIELVHQFTSHWFLSVVSSPQTLTTLCLCVLPWVLLLQRLHSGEQLDALLQLNSHVLLRDLHAGMLHVLLHRRRKDRF